MLLGIAESDSTIRGGGEDEHALATAARATVDATTTSNHCLRTNTSLASYHEYTYRSRAKVRGRRRGCEYLAERGAAACGC
ncbi:hypothetical protein GCM10009554_40580 [Kribbella koreensis]|uniref:Uncharacterized protein n=1 Tax=Kribbella koreensis TaxID=57909 RepID=A0ABP4BB91_9ACTN